MTNTFLFAILATSASLVAAPAAADPLAAGAVPTETETAGAQEIDVGTALGDDELDVLRGGETLMLSNQTLTAITSGNVIEGNYVAGSVSLSDFALSNFNGIGNLAINTGGQVNLQTGISLIVNVGQ